MNLGSPTRIKIVPNPEKTEVRFHLSFPEGRQQAEFDLTAAGAMFLLAALQRIQALHKLPIPKSLRPSGPPALRVLTDEDE